jgi:hypothetical protein
MTTSRLRAGVAELEITPELGVELAVELAPQTAGGTHTPLMARALVLSGGDQQLAVVTLDLYGLQPSAAEELLAAIDRCCGLAPQQVMLICSHTRGAPCTTPVVGSHDVNRAFVGAILDQVPGVVDAALGSLRDASLGVGHAVLPHLVYNHRLMTRNMKAITAWLGVPRDEVLFPEGPTDPEFSVLVIRDDHGFPICLGWNFAADNRFPLDGLVSAGLSQLVQVELDKRLGRHVPLLHLTGCGGDVSFIPELEEAVDAVTSGVMAVQLETPCDPLIRLASSQERMVLPIRDYSRFWSQADVELKAPEAVEVFARELNHLQREGAQAVPASVRAFRLGRFALVGMPGMPFVEFALDLKARSPAQATVVAANVGGDVGILASRPSFDHGGFETWPSRSARVGPGGGEFVAERALHLLNGLWNRRGV